LTNTVLFRKIRITEYGRRAEVKEKNKEYMKEYRQNKLDLNNGMIC